MKWASVVLVNASRRKDGEKTAVEEAGDAPPDKSIYQMQRRLEIADTHTNC